MSCNIFIEGFSMNTKLMKRTGLVLLATILGACSTPQQNTKEQTAASLGDITIVSREDGSGTRGAFIEITGVLAKENGKEIDKTTKAATIQNNTEGVLSTVAGDKSAVGYISLGSLKDTVKALKINGVEPTAENVLNGKYPLQRPFNVAWRADKLSKVGEDFIKFVHSKDGQDIVVANKYIQAKKDTQAYTSSGVQGTLSIVGSTSVSPVIEKLAEAYKAKNPGVTINITANGSSAGMTAASDGTADIGMASRELKESEKAKLKYEPIALDGIAIIVNKVNPIADMTMDHVKGIYTGSLQTWAEIK